MDKNNSDKKSDTDCDDNCACLTCVPLDDVLN